MIAKSHTRAGEPVHFGNNPGAHAGAGEHLSELRHGLGQPVEHAVPPLQALDPRGRHLDAADRALAGRHHGQGRRSATRRATCPTSWRRSSTSPARPIPSTWEGQPIEPLEGQSLAPAFARDVAERPPMFWEHEGNAAVRIGKWKLVRNYPGPWELYDMEADRTELHDLAAAPSRARRRHGAAVRGLGQALRRDRPREDRDADGEPGRHARLLGESRSAGHALRAARPTAAERGAARRPAYARALRRPHRAAAPELIAIGARSFVMGNDVGRRRAGRRRRPGAARDARRLRHRTGHRHQPGVRRLRAGHALCDRRRAGSARPSSSTCKRRRPCGSRHDRSRAACLGGCRWPMPAGSAPKARARMSTTGSTIRSCMSRGTMRRPIAIGPGCACRPRRNGSARRAAASREGASPGATTCGMPAASRAATSGAGTFPPRPADGWTPGARRRPQRRGQWLRPVQLLRQCLGMVRRLVQPGLSPRDGG